MVNPLDSPVGRNNNKLQSQYASVVNESDTLDQRFASTVQSKKGAKGTAGGIFGPANPAANMLRSPQLLHMN